MRRRRGTGVVGGVHAGLGDDDDGVEVVEVEGVADDAEDGEGREDGGDGEEAVGRVFGEAGGC